MKVLKDVLRRDLVALLLLAATTVGNITVFWLYGVLMEPFFYVCALTFSLLLITIALQCVRARRRAEARKRVLAGILQSPFCLPEPRTAAEEDYQQMIRRLGEYVCTSAASFESERQDALDYYAAWVHQIKTPIAVMKLGLREDTAENRALQSELFRIEQYVDMVLQYIRLGSSTNDLVIREYALDLLIKETVRKFAPQFIEKKLALAYTPTDRCIVIDKKWFCCILEQYISNAVKYTPAGSISIAVDGNTLTVADTGIGIAAEDLPRIFEKGYTGQNGRLGEKSSGLGLHLAKKAADLLALSLGAESTPGVGSRFSITLPETQRPIA